MNRILCTLSIFALLLNACSKEEDNSKPVVNNDSVTLETSIQAGNLAKGVWADNDVIKVINVTKSDLSVNLNLLGVVGSANGTFTGHVENGFDTGDKIFAFYPSTLVFNQENVSYDCSTQDGSDDGSRSKLFLCASGSYGSPSKMVFSQIGSLLKIDVNVGTQKKLTEVTLTAPGLFCSGMYHPENGWSDEKVGDIKATLNNGNGVETDNNGHLQVYLAVLPQVLSSGLFVTVVDNDGIEYLYTYETSIEFTENSMSSVNNNYNKEWTKTAGAVDLGLSVKWATYNIMATAPENAGDFFAWGETSTKSEFNSSTYTIPSSFKEDFSGNATYDVATKMWGGYWRVPTIDEWNELIDNCKWEWDATKKGHKVTSLKEGYTNKSIFIPAAGWMEGHDLKYNTTNGAYWSSTPFSTLGIDGYGAHMSSSSQMWNNDPRYLGLCIRAVKY